MPQGLTVNAENKELKVQSLMHLSEIHRNAHNERRRFEYRVLFTTLSLYVLTAAAKVQGVFPSKRVSRIEFAIWFLFLGLSVIAGFFLGRLHRANRINLDIGEAAEAELTALFDLEQLNQSRADAEDKRPWEHSALAWQAATLLITAIGSAYIVTAP